MQKIEHIGIAVRAMDEAVETFSRLFGQPPYKTEAVESEGVETAFFRTGTNKVELLASTDPQGPIARFVDKRGPGIHHIAFAVADIHAEIERLSAEGFTPLSDGPTRGADGKLIIFFHPKTTGGVLIELCQDAE